MSKAAFIASPVTCFCCPWGCFCPWRFTACHTQRAQIPSKFRLQIAQLPNSSATRVNETQSKALGRASVPADKEPPRAAGEGSQPGALMLQPWLLPCPPALLLERHVTAVKISDSKKSKNYKLADLNILHPNLDLFFSGWIEVTASPLLFSPLYCLSHAQVITWSQPVYNNKCLCCKEEGIITKKMTSSILFLVSEEYLIFCKSEPCNLGHSENKSVRYI